MEMKGIYRLVEERATLISSVIVPISWKRSSKRLADKDKRFHGLKRHAFPGGPSAVETVS